jgi:serine/threonine-protein kinase
MSMVLALILVVLSTLLLLRAPGVMVPMALVIALAAGMALLGGEPWTLVAAGLLGLASMVAPRLRTTDRGSAPTKPGKKTPAGPKAPARPTISAAVSGLEGSYEILEKVGIGGMATVYKAKTKSDGKIVALKVPQEKYVDDPRFVRRFHREAELLAHLDHANIVKVFDHGNYGDTHYISMEFLDGEGLDRLIESRKMPMPVVVEIMVRVAEALQHIHAQGIIHRDIKPGNIMVLKGAVRPDGSVDPKGVRLMDFGIAAGKVLTRLTITGARIGTPVYMSPEQAKGQRIDHKSDIYSFGVVFYESLCGQPPFQGAYEAVIHQQITQMPTPPKQVNPEIPQALSDIVYRTLEKDPEKRPGLEAVVEALKSNWKEDPGLSATSYLALAVEAKRGTLRLMDFQGTLNRMWSGVGSGRGMFPSPPLSLALDPAGGFWISLFEYGGGAVRLVHRFNADGEVLLSIAPYGQKLGEMLYPISLTVSQNMLYVLDGETNTITQFDLSGNPMARFGGSGKGRGMFDSPRQIVSGRHYLYVLDYGNRQVQRLSLSGEYLSRYAFRKNRETNELRGLGGVGVGPGEELFIYDMDSKKIRKVSLDGDVELSLALPLLEGEDPSAQVEMMLSGDILFATRRGSTRIHRLKLGGEALAPLEVYAPLRGIALWQNPKPTGASSPQRPRVAG